jgi:sugar lactone lactonase YvrE
VDGEGNLYISDGFNYRIRKVDKDGIISTFAGTGEAGYSGDGGPATEAALNLPTGIALDGEGNLFIACHHNSRVRKVDKNGTIATFAGTSEWGFNSEKGPATKVMLNQPWGLFIDDDSGVLYIPDTFNARIRAVHLEDS